MITTDEQLIGGDLPTTPITAIRTMEDYVPEPNRTLGWDVLRWATDWLTQPDGPNAGDPWQYTPEQVRIILRWYEINNRGEFTFRRGVIRRMKGWG